MKKDKSSYREVRIFVYLLFVKIIGFKIQFPIIDNLENFFKNFYSIRRNFFGLFKQKKYNCRSYIYFAIWQFTTINTSESSSNTKQMLLHSAEYHTDSYKMIATAKHLNGKIMTSMFDWSHGIVVIKELKKYWFYKSYKNVKKIIKNIIFRLLIKKINFKFFN